MYETMNFLQHKIYYIIEPYTYCPFVISVVIKGRDVEVFCPYEPGSEVAMKSGSKIFGIFTSIRLRRVVSLTLRPLYLRILTPVKQGI
jgi:hypothetical protein